MANKVSQDVKRVQLPMTVKRQQFSFHNAMKPFIITGQLFSLFPVSEVSKDAEKLKFSWISYKTIYSIIVIILQILYTISVTFFSKLTMKNFFGFVVVVWNIRALINFMLLVKLSTMWPALIKKWNEVDLKVPNNGVIRRKVLVIIILLSVTGIGEHMVFVAGAIRRVLQGLQKEESFFEKYFRTIYTEFFDVVDYSHWLAVAVEFLALATTMSWQFCNIIIITSTAVLADKFTQFTKRIKSCQTSNTPLWLELQKQYCDLAVLTKKLSDSLSGVIMSSVVAGTYALSIFIFQMFDPKTLYEIFYFWYGVIFIFVHLFTVFLYGAQVNEESIKSILLMFEIPSQKMPHESYVLLQQMLTNDIAIYGGRMFKITRHSFLRVLSTIITLQLLLFQFEANISANV